ncbi:hypothetical protein QJ856_gp0086 [Tupanvirus deep ocean]|uniref:Uncharacterized protein n=2 Tax=Tupanvirus TaxID=2094720 RepID=A0AC62AA30_9VIRU|nr:hypothetical protein QJ856_gp0086 [Tupanvirus deep ocean]QKU34641.1 hypothetical protein [Tupanvirus deep ocean]
MSKYVKKLGSDKTYKRPKKTFQETLSADEISKLLQGYEKVDDIAEVPLNTHLRYFKTNADGSQTFRTGGFLHNKQNPETFVMLSNGKQIWSVQTKGTVFFKKMSQKDEIAALHALYKKKLAEKDEVINKLKKYIRTKINNPDQNIIASQNRISSKQATQSIPKYIQSQSIPKSNTLFTSANKNTSSKNPNPKHKSSGSKTSNPSKYPTSSKHYASKTSKKN